MSFMFVCVPSAKLETSFRSMDTGVLLRGPPQGSLRNPRKPWIVVYFPGFLGYFRDVWSNIKAFGQNNVIFELLQQK